MKKFLIIACSIVLTLFLLTVAVWWFIKPSHPVVDTRPDEVILKELIARLEDDNGAKYYLQACLMYEQSPNDDSTWDRLMRVLENRYQEETPELEGFINKNEPAFALISKGTRQEFCSMPPLGFTDACPYFAIFRRIVRLMVAKARLLQRNGEYEKARETYIEVLRFAGDVRRNGGFIHATCSQAYDDYAYAGLDSYIRVEDDTEACEKLLNAFIGIHEERVLLRAILANEFTMRQEHFDNEPMDFFYLVPPGEDTSSVDYSIGMAFYALRYMWVRLRVPLIRREMDRMHRVILDASSKSYHEALGDELTERVPENEFTELQFPVDRRFIRLIGMGEVRQRAYILKTALGLFFLEHGEYPEGIEELTTLVPEHILTDPFSMEQFIYKRTDDGYMFYSLGPDLDDDGGEEMDPPSKDDGDIVFSEPREQETSDAGSS